MCPLVKNIAIYTFCLISVTNCIYGAQREPEIWRGAGHDNLFAYLREDLSEIELKNVLVTTCRVLKARYPNYPIIYFQNSLINRCVDTGVDEELVCAAMWPNGNPVIGHQ